MSVSIDVAHTLAGLQADLVALPAKDLVGLSNVVRKNVKQAERVMVGIAKGSAGSHGSNYHKRIGSDMRGPLEGDAGPHGTVAGNAVGAGWRNGPANTDTEKTADIVGPRFFRDVDKHVDGLFW